MKIDTKFVPITFILKTVKQWESDHKTLPTGDIVFQNKEFLLNVRFTNKSLNSIKKNPRGMEHIPQAIEKPMEIWGSWENVKAQKEVLLNYLLFDDEHVFVVQTMKGEVTNSLINTKANINKYRKGILFVK